MEKLEELEKSQEILKLSEVMFRSVIETAVYAIIISDGDGNIVSWNRSAEKLFGYSFSEISGKPLNRLIPEWLCSDQSEGLLQASPESGVRDTCKSVEQFGVRKDGTEFPLELSHSQWKEGGTVFSTVIMRDITERKQAEDRLRAIEGRYNRFVNAMIDCTYTVDIKNGSVVGISHISNCISVTGYTPEEFLDRPDLFDGIVHEEDRYAADKQIRQLLNSTTCKPLEYRIIHKDGAIRSIRRILLPEYNKNGDLVGYDGLLSDITRQKEIELRLIQSEKMASLGVLSAGIAHEIKNPLSIILKGIELLELPSFKTDTPDVLEKMKEAVFRASTITRDMLTFSRQYTPELEDVDLMQVVNETLSMLDHIIKFQQIKIVSNFSSALPRIKVDSTQMKQMVINLLTNASEAMTKGGIITITADTAKNITNDNVVRLVIADTGSGIKPEDAQKIFDPFYTTKKKSGGTGLGLSVVKGIVEKHGGDIKIESELGKGSTVIVELPYAI